MSNVWRFGSRLPQNPVRNLGTLPTPEPEKGPTFNAVIFGAVIAFAFRKYSRAARRVG